MTTKICTKCNDRPVLARGLCKRCYEAKRRGPRVPKPHHKRLSKVVASCHSCGNTAKLAAKGLCGPCYRRASGYVAKQRRARQTGVQGACTGCGATARIAARGLCWKCYRGSRR